MPTDINVDRITTEGPKLLRAYIDYAMNGSQVLASEITESSVVEHDSPFEEAVYDYLDRRGYKLATQVGCSGFRIDMAVKHPTLSGIYVLGIECDGAAYHSAKTARERDRLRQDVLEAMGWKIYRIWSTDWNKDPVNEGRRLIEAVEDAIRSYGADESKKQSVEASDEEEFISIEDKPSSKINTNELYGFVSKIPYSLSNIIGISQYSSVYHKLQGAIKLVVANEYPVHIDLLCQRLAPLFGNIKATKKVTREVEYELTRMKNEVEVKDSFVYPKGYSSIPIRMPNDRPIQFISTEELATAMKKILNRSVGMTKEGLIEETTRVYGFLRTGAKIQAAMQDAISYLERNGSIDIIDNKINLLQ